MFILLLQQIVVVRIDGASVKGIYSLLSRVTCLLFNISYFVDHIGLWFVFNVVIHCLLLLKSVFAPNSQLLSCMVQCCFSFQNFYADRFGCNAVQIIKDSNVVEREKLESEKVSEKVVSRRQV